MCVKHIYGQMYFDTVAKTDPCVLCVCVSVESLIFWKAWITQAQKSKPSRALAASNRTLCASLTVLVWVQV